MLDKLDAKQRIAQRNRWPFGLEGFAVDDVPVHVDGRDFSELDRVLGFAGADWKSVGISGHCDGGRCVLEYQMVLSAVCGLSLIHISEPTRPY